MPCCGLYVEFDGIHGKESDWVIAHSFPECWDLINDGRDEDIAHLCTYQAGFKGTWPECEIAIIGERFHISEYDARKLYNNPDFYF